MPIIPKYQSDSNIQLGTPPTMSLAAASRSEQADKAVVSSLERAEQVITDVRDFRQISEANAYTLDKLNEIKSLADQDIDFDSARYEQEIDKAGIEAVKTISGRTAREKFLSQFNQQAVAAKWGIKNTFRAKELEASKATVAYNQQKLVDTYAGMNDAEKMQSVATFKNILTSAVQSGVLYADEAKKIDLETQQSLRKSVVNNDIINNPDAALAELNKGRDGAYSELSEEDRTKAIVSAKSYIKKYDNQERAEKARLQRENENAVLDTLIDPNKPDPTENDIVQLMRAEQIDSKFAKSVINDIRSGSIYKAVTDFNTYSDIMKKIVTKGVTATAIQSEIIQAHAEGKLNDSDRDSLLFTQKLGQTPIFQKSIQEQQPSFLKTAWDFISNGFTNKKEQAIVMSNTISKIQKTQAKPEQIPQIAQEEIEKQKQQNRLKNYPWVSELSQAGELRLFPDGIKRRVFPDGRIEEIK